MSAHFDIQLGRLDLTHYGSNRRNCLKVLPSLKGKKAKLVLGGEDGVLQCLSIKKGEAVQVFKNAPGKREVTALALGGPPNAKDRIYAAYGQTIQGVNKKKGAQFFNYSTVLNEDISSLYIEDLTIYTACEYSVNVFESNKNGDNVSDIHFYQSPDKINHACMTRIPNGGVMSSSAATAAGVVKEGYNTVLACQDKYIRIIKDSDLLHESRVQGAVTSVAMYDGPVPPEKKRDENDIVEGSVQQKQNYKPPGASTDYKQIIYGTETGVIGQYYADSSSMKAGFTIGGGQNSQKKSGITSMILSDITLNGYDDIVVGRDDGTIEVYQYDQYSNLTDSEPIFTRELNESITTLDKGQLIANNSQDLVVSTYSGKVVTYTHELKHSTISHIIPKISNIKENSTSTTTTSLGLPGSIVSQVDGSSTNIRKETKEELEKNIKEMKLEIEKLNEKVVKEKEKYTTKVSSELIAIEQQFKVKSSLKLVPEEACYLLTLEIDLPMDSILLQSNIPIMLLEGGNGGTVTAGIEGAIPPSASSSSSSSTATSSTDFKSSTTTLAQTNKDTAKDLLTSKVLISRTDRDEKNGNELLASFRIQDSTTSLQRYEIKLRTVEGQYGVLNAYIVSKIQPKTCQRTELRIKPLSLHERVDRESIAEEIKIRPLNTLHITGAFTLSDIHAWILFCLPDVSQKVGSASTSESSTTGSNAVNPNSSSNLQTLYFRSTFLHTILVIEYEKGSAYFRSENMTVISILKEVITKEATNKKISISVELDLKFESIETVLNLLRKELDQHFTLAKKYALIEALKEIATHETGSAGTTDPNNPGAAATSNNYDQLTTILSPHLLDILQNSSSLSTQYKNAPRHLDFLRGIVTDLFVDKHKLQGRSAQARVPVLLEILENYSFEKLKQVFRE